MPDVEALEALGVRQVTATDAPGDGLRPRHKEVYCGAERSEGFARKMRDEIVGAEGDAADVVDAVVRAVSLVTLVHVRTGERRFPSRLQ